MNDHASALQSLCRWDEAVEVLREMCSRESSDRRPPETTLDSRMELAHSLLSSQQLDEASYEYRKCLEIARDAVADLRNDSTSSENDRRIRNILRHLAHIYELTTNRTGALTAYAQLQHEFLARPGRPQNIWTYQWLRGKMFLLQERWDYAIRVLVSAPSSRLGLEAAKMADRPVTDETKKSLRAILERPHLDARTATTDLPLEIHTHHEAVSVTAAKTTEPAAKGVVIMTKVKETSETKDTHGADDGANTASGGNMVQPTPEIATDTYTVAQAVKDAVLAALEKQVFQKQHAKIVDTADMDDEESISDEDHDIETVDGVLRAKYAFPLVPQDTEWEQLQYPRLPNTYQKWVQQKREAERNRRIWM
ncbi:hypothetical protein BN1723_001599 [Verticillium longisporum]|nr:hypothetical protein BN1723_001599 [Verticillium longisporum]